MDTNGWSTKVPKQLGSYWFFGWQFASELKTSSPKLLFVEVWKIVNGFAYVSEGNFLDRKELYGVWRRVESPPLPPMVQVTVTEKNWRHNDEEFVFVDFDPDAFPDLVLPEK